MDERIRRLHIHQAKGIAFGLLIDTQDLCITAEQAAEFLRQVVANKPFKFKITILPHNSLLFEYQGCTNTRAHQIIRNSCLHKFVLQDSDGEPSSEYTVDDYRVMEARWSQPAEATPEEGRVGKLLAELLAALPPGHELVIRRIAE